MSDNNQNFRDLKRLLKLKQHEIPPPGFFSGFSGDVLARIQAGESGSGKSFLERMQADSPFASMLLQLLAARPGVVGALATSVCLMLLMAVLFVDRSEPGAVASDSAFFAQSTSPATPTTAAIPTEVASSELLATSDTGITISTNQVSSLQPMNNLFGAPANGMFQTVKFSPLSQ